MNRKFLTLIIGIFIGVFSWGIIPFVSDKSEPFYIGQLASSIIAIILGFKYGLKHLLIYILGFYISLNLYPIIFYFSKVTEYAIYGLLAALPICFYPLVFGVVGRVVKVGYIEYSKSLKTEPPKSSAS